MCFLGAFESGFIYSLADGRTNEFPEAFSVFHGANSPSHAKTTNYSCWYMCACLREHRVLIAPPKSIYFSLALEISKMENVARLWCKNLAWHSFLGTILFVIGCKFLSFFHTNSIYSDILKCACKFLHPVRRNSFSYRMSLFETQEFYLHWSCSDFLWNSLSFFPLPRFS